MACASSAASGQVGLTSAMPLRYSSPSRSVLTTESRVPFEVFSGAMSTVP